MNWFCRTGAVLAVALTGVLLSGCGTDESQDAVSSPIDWGTVNQAVGDCLAERGWDISYDEDGSVISEYPVEQSEAFRSDSEDCRAQNRPEESEPTAAQWTAYFARLKESADCLRGMGFDISQAPSRDVFVEQYLEDPWLPHGEAFDSATSAEEWEAIEEACPQPQIS